MPHSRALELILAALIVLPGCVGVFASPRGASLSWGTHSHGALLGAVALPVEGDGYQVHPEWRARGRTFAIEELIGGLTHAFARVAQAAPGSMAYVGDLSLRRGGDSSMHRSHESGRDVDIFYYAADRDGNPMPNLPAMLRFADDGSAVAWSSAKLGRRIREPLADAHLDLRRNWALVANLLSDPIVEVQWIFIHRPLAELLLQEAEREKADPALLARAREILHQPTDARPHDDHMHVRVFCPAQSRVFGCADKGPRRWWKKRWKYMSSLAVGSSWRLSGNSGPPERPARGSRVAVSESVGVSEFVGGTRTSVPRIASRPRSPLHGGRNRYRSRSRRPICVGPEARLPIWACRS